MESRKKEEKDQKKKKGKKKKVAKRDIFVQKKSVQYFAQFSPHFGENFLVGLGRKHSDPTIFFSSLPPN